MQVHDYMFKIEETCRDLKNKLNQKNPNALNSEQSVIDDMNAKDNADGHTLEEMQKMNNILIRAREVQYKKQSYQKSKYEKKVGKLKDKIDLLTNKIAEQDKVSYKSLLNSLGN